MIVTNAENTIQPFKLEEKTIILFNKIKEKLIKILPIKKTDINIFTQEVNNFMNVKESIQIIIKINSYTESHIGNVYLIQQPGFCGTVVLTSFSISSGFYIKDKYYKIRNNKIGLLFQELIIQICKDLNYGRIILHNLEGNKHRNNDQFIYYREILDKTGFTRTKRLSNPRTGNIVSEFEKIIQDPIEFKEKIYKKSIKEKDTEISYLINN